MNPLTRFLTLVIACLTVAACPPTDPPARGRITVFTQNGQLHLELASDVAPLALSGTVMIEGAELDAPAIAGDAAAVQDLLRQNSPSTRVLRFALADSRGVPMKRNGVVVRIPLQGTPSRVEVKELSAAQGNAQRIQLEGFNGPPEVR